LAYLLNSAIAIATNAGCSKYHHVHFNFTLFVFSYFSKAAALASSSLELVLPFRLLQEFLFMATLNNQL
jgi:hypothetical protein